MNSIQMEADAIAERVENDRFYKLTEEDNIVLLMAMGFGRKEAEVFGLKKKNTED